MPRVGLAFAYDGAAFDSYARQPGRRTAEGELIAALERAGAFVDARSARFRSGSRTDRGVSADFTVCAFDSDLRPGRVVRRLRPPRGLRIHSARRVPDDFNPRHARWRRYVYEIPRTTGIDVALLRRTLRGFVGSHDFRNFSRPEPGRTTRRRIDAITVWPTRRRIVVRVQAPNFLWHQVRRLIAAGLGVATGRFDAADVRRALRRPKERRDFGLAPPGPLRLERVAYSIPFRRRPT